MTRTAVGRTRDVLPRRAGPVTEAAYARAEPQQSDKPLGEPWPLTPGRMCRRRRSPAVTTGSSRRSCSVATRATGWGSSRPSSTAATWSPSPTQRVWPRCCSTRLTEMTQRSADPDDRAESFAAVRRTSRWCARWRAEARRCGSLRYSASHHRDRAGERVSVGEVGEYLSTIDGADRAAPERVSPSPEVVTEAEEGTSLGMAALIYRGKGLIATTRTKKFLSLYPYSGAVIASASTRSATSRPPAGASTIRQTTNWRTPSCDASSRHVGLRSTRKHVRRVAPVEGCNLRSLVPGHTHRRESDGQWTTGGTADACLAAIPRFGDPPSLLLGGAEAAV